MTFVKASRIITKNEQIDRSKLNNRWDWDEIIELAKRAPSSHNSQPWSITIMNNQVNIYCDITRQLKIVDPDMREAYISCGAFARFIQIVANAGGRILDLSWARDIDQEQPLAVLRESDELICKEDDLPKVYAMSYRSTYRGQFAKREVATGLITEIIEKDIRESIKALFIEGDDRKVFEDHIRISNKLQYGDLSFRLELIHWIRSSQSLVTKLKDGLTWYALGLSKIGAYFFKKMLKHYNIANIVNRRDLAKLRVSKNLLVIGSRDDSATSLLDTGAFLADLTLNLCLLGIYVTFYNQPIQLSNQRASLKKDLSLDFDPQLVMTLGYPKRLPLRKTPRRVTEDIVRYISPPYQNINEDRDLNRTEIA